MRATLASWATEGMVETDRQYYYVEKDCVEAKWTSQGQCQKPAFVYMQYREAGLVWKGREMERGKGTPVEQTRRLKKIRSRRQETKTKAVGGKRFEGMDNHRPYSRGSHAMMGRGGT